MSVLRIKNQKCQRAWLFDKRFSVSLFKYCENMYREKTIEKLDIVVYNTENYCLNNCIN